MDPKGEDAMVNPKSFNANDRGSKDQNLSHRGFQARRGTTIEPDLYHNENPKDDSGDNRAPTVPNSHSSSNGRNDSGLHGYNDPHEDLIDEYEMGFDELEEIKGVDAFIVNETDSSGQDNTDLRFSMKS